MSEFTHPTVLRDSPDYGRPEDVPNWAERQARALIPDGVVNGRPLCPFVNEPDFTGPTAGRNGLWLWGENPMVDALVTCTYAGRRWVLLVQRRDDGTWAMPGGSIEPGDESYLFAALRECEEETGFDPSEEAISATCDKPRWVPDPRGSMEAWAVTVVVRFDLGDVESLPEVRGGDDAQDARWAAIEHLPDPFYVGHIFPAHREILASVR